MSSISSTQAEKQRISRIWRGTSRSWAALKLALFQPLGIKVPLEAAGLLLVGALAFFATHRSSNYLVTTQPRSAALESRPVAPATAVPPPSVLEPLRDNPRAADAAVPVPVRPQVAKATPAAPARPATPSPKNKDVPPEGLTGSGDAAPTQQAADSGDREMRDAEMNTAKTEETATPLEAVESLDGAKTADRESDADRQPVFRREGPPYFFLYKPSIKPL